MILIVSAPIMTGKYDIANPAADAPIIALDSCRHVAQSRCLYTLSARGISNLSTVTTGTKMLAFWTMESFLFVKQFYPVFLQSHNASRNCGNLVSSSH
jgi:hypothetical protein